MLLSFKNCGTTCTDHENSSSSSSSIVASNVDLLLHILLPLPVKSLLVFKTVSKQWLSLISDQYFVRKHSCLQHRSSIPGLLVLKNKSSENSPDFEFIFPDGNVFDSSHGPPGSFPFLTLNDNKGIDIVRSCNGLLIYQRFGNSRFESKYYVYNPSTMHYKILPPSPFRKPNYRCHVNLAFDPIKSPHYKAIFIWRKDGNNCQMEIYSSETDSWRLSISLVNVESGVFDRSGVYWNGSLHWVSGNTGPSLYFDIDNELMRTMPMPPLPYVTTRGRCINYIGVYKDHMHLIDEIYPHMKGRFDILEMDSDYRGWNVKFRLNLNDIITVLHPDINWGTDHVFNNGFGFSILKFFDEDGEGESSKLVIQAWKDLNIFSYDIKEMSFKKISSHSSWLLNWSSIHLYIPTLTRV